MKKSRIANILLGVLQLFNGLSGLLGGFMLITDPTGDTLNMKLEWLERTPFANFLIPGIVLLALVGIMNSLGAWLTFRKRKNRGYVGLTFGLILMMWIIAQVLWIGYKDFLQPLYLTTGLVQSIAGMLVSSGARKS